MSCGRDVISVFPQRFPGETRSEDLDRLHDEAGSDLGEGAVLLGQNLVVAKPNLAVDHGKRVHVVEERLALRVEIRNGKNLWKEKRDKG